jgi:hypothetical protein
MLLSDPHLMIIKLTLGDFYGYNIITYKYISLLCKLDQCMDSFQDGQQTKKRNEKVMSQRSSKLTLVDMINGLSLAIFANNGYRLPSPFLLD